MGDNRCNVELWQFSTVPHMREVQPYCHSQDLGHCRRISEILLSGGRSQGAIAAHFLVVVLHCNSGNPRPRLHTSVSSRFSWQIENARM